MKKVPFKKTLALLLLGFVSNSYAIDTYNAVTKTITIPQVMVGATTYNDVVLKLNDFEVLSLASDPLVGVLDENFVMQFISAEKQDGQLHITIKLTSKGEDRNDRIGVSYPGTKARLTDDKGNIYDAETMTIPRIDKEFSGYTESHLFDADTPVTIVLTYDDIDAQATKINLFDLVLNGGSSYKVRDIPFTNFSFGG